MATKPKKPASAKPAAAAGPEKPKRKMTKHPFWERSFEGPRLLETLKREAGPLFVVPAEFNAFILRFQRTYEGLSKRPRAKWNDKEALRQRLAELEQTGWDTMPAPTGAGHVDPPAQADADQIDASEPHPSDN